MLGSAPLLSGMGGGRKIPRGGLMIDLCMLSIVGEGRNVKMQDVEGILARKQGGLT